MRLHWVPIFTLALLGTGPQTVQAENNLGCKTPVIPYAYSPQKATLEFTFIRKGMRSPFTETELKNGARKFSESNPISEEGFQNFVLSKDQFGEYVSIDYIPTGPSRDTPVVSNSSGSSTAIELSTRKFQSAEEALSAFEKFVKKERFSESTRASMLTWMNQNPSSIKDYEDVVNQELKKIGNPPSGSGAPRGDRLTLSNYGPNRFFWLIPNGESKYYPVRVHEILKSAPGDKLTILLEYSSDLLIQEKRVSHIFELTENEKKTIRRDDRDYSSARAEEEFNRGLSWTQAETKELASTLRLRLYGHSEFLNNTRSYYGYSPYSALMVMNSDTWKIIKSFSEDVFGSLDFLFFPFEKNVEVNIIDAFSRLDPSYVTKFFKSQHLEYMWVITEDGSLKVSPKMPLKNNFKPPLLRLASGKKIFAGGNFNFDYDGSIHLTFDSNEYQNAQAEFGKVYAFDSESLNLRDFVRVVFLKQAQTRISAIHSRLTETFASGNPYSQRPTDNTAGDWSSFQTSNSNIYDFAKESMKGKTFASVPPWDLDSGKPLSLEEWEKLTQDRTSSASLHWAFYVLNTTENTSLSAHNQAYKKLSLQFHTDLNKSEEAGWIQRKLNEAIKIIREKLK
jgi:hypothetical protein